MTAYEMPAPDWVPREYWYWTARPAPPFLPTTSADQLVSERHKTCRVYLKRAGLCGNSGHTEYEVIVLPSPYTGARIGKQPRSVGRFTICEPITAQKKHASLEKFMRQVVTV